MQNKKQKNTDARSLAHDKLTEIRMRGVAAVQNGKSPKDVARLLGVHRATVYHWLSQYRAGGWGNLDAKKRGGRKCKLDAKAMAWLYQAITLKNPQQFNFTLALWTNKLVMELIRQRLDLALSKASVCRLLVQLGLSAQNPLWRAYLQEPEMLTRWLRENYPPIRARAKRQKAEIWFASEAGVRAQTTWRPGGHAPFASGTEKRPRPKMISAVNPQGHFRFMCIEGRINGGVFVDFLTRLIHNSPRKIFLIVDDLPTHKAQEVGSYVTSVADRLELFFLPPYSPELDQEEFLWDTLKNKAIGRRVIPDPETGGR